MYILSPSIYAADYMELRQQIRLMEQAGIRRLHVDIMDGNFVPNLSFGPDFVQALRNETEMELDVHLMVDRPERFIRTFVNAGSDIITVHCESCDDIVQAIKQIQWYENRAGVVLKPETSLEELKDDVWDLADVIQIMTVQPGLKGQHFITPMLEKISQARARIQKLDRTIDIEVDGDINEVHLKEVQEAGANVIVVGKALFQGSLKENLCTFQKMEGMVS